MTTTTKKTNKKITKTSKKISTKNMNANKIKTILKNITIPNYNFLHEAL